MKVKVNEASGPVLDWMVASIRGFRLDLRIVIDGEEQWAFLPYSTDWSQGGPIIDREKIGTWPAEREDKSGLWGARMLNTYICYGPTPLIAAMRCYVASKLGEEVEVPDELV